MARRVATLMWLGDKDVADHFWRLQMQGDVAGDLIEFQANAGAGRVDAVSGSGVTVNTWHHVAGVTSASTSRFAYIDGVAGAENTNNRAPAGTDRVALGRSMTSSPSRPHSGRIADAAIWSVALSTAEVALLAGGQSPALIQPASLVNYWRLIDDGLTTEIDFVGSQDLAESGSYGTKNAAHPPLVLKTGDLTSLNQIAMQTSQIVSY